MLHESIATARRGVRPARELTRSPPIGISKFARTQEYGYLYLEDTDYRSKSGTGVDPARSSRHCVRYRVR